MVRSANLYFNIDIYKIMLCKQEIKFSKYINLQCCDCEYAGARLLMAKSITLNQNVYLDISGLAATIMTLHISEKY